MRNKLLLTVALLIPLTVHGATTAELQAQINALLAQIQALQAQLVSSGGAATTAASATLLASGNLTLGSKGAAVADLQKYLNANGAQVAASGAGSPGNETQTFGSLTKAALAKWQAANGVSPAAGYFGPLTRAKMSAMGVVTTEAAAPAEMPSPVSESVPTSVAATTTPTAVVTLPNPFESTLKIETIYSSLTLSSYGEKTLTAFKVSADEKIAITKIRFKNKGTYGNSYLTKFKLLVNADSGPVLSEADISTDGVVEFKLTADETKENKGLIVSGNSYYVRAYIVTHSYGAEKPYIRLDIESAADVSAYDYNDLNRIATITQNNSFPIRGSQITAF